MMLEQQSIVQRDGTVLVQGWGKLTEPSIKYDLGDHALNVLELDYAESFGETFILAPR